MVLHGLLADGQADAGARVLLPVIQALEYGKYLLRETELEPKEALVCNVYM